MAYTDIDNSTAFFQTVIYTGNGATGRSITLPSDTNMQPDWVWLKSRGEAEHHQLTDSVRGVNKQLYSHLAYAEATETDRISAFNSDGFTIENDIIVNKNNIEFVAWCWKAGTSFTNDASSTSVGSVDTAGSVNTDAGFSIMKYTGVAGEQTIAHGLGAVPKLILVKNLDSTENWRIYHHSLGAGAYIKLNTADAKVDDTGPFSNTTPTSSVITMGGDDGTMHANEELIAYIFAEKQGYSKFGTYTGNANANGPFIYTGFKPAFFIYKNTNTSGEEWKILDNKRDPFNRGSQRNLNAHTNTAESDDVNSIGEFVSNGVKIRSAHNNINKSGSPFIYIAFAENPFVTSTGVPATAR